ncbi:MAG: ATP synthase F1 subunit delta [Candidatus Aminicenantes bacterium]|jgi:F-type H+-transporting ATPase subunit delta|nr:ATP synthase F1 subunit delta [Candidatus Aminicenantes bacterium]
MKNRLLVKKYTRGLVGALEGEAEFLRVQGEIEGFVGLMRSREDLRGALANPFLNARKKTGIVRDIVSRMGYLDKTTRFLSMVVQHGRLEILPEIAAGAPAAWNERKGVLTFEVSSVVPLTEEQKDRLKDELERLEGKPVSLAFEADPAIIGGLSLRKGNVVYDVSVEGDLLKLKEKIQEGQR